VYTHIHCRKTDKTANSNFYSIENVFCDYFSRYRREPLWIRKQKNIPLGKIEERRGNERQISAWLDGAWIMKQRRSDGIVVPTGDAIQAKLCRKQARRPQTSAGSSKAHLWRWCDGSSGMLIELGWGWNPPQTRRRVALQSFAISELGEILLTDTVGTPHKILTSSQCLFRGKS